MLKKIKTWLEKKQQEQKKKLQLVKAKKYYKLIQTGGLFLKFIYADIEQMKKKQVNRHMRRRFTKELEQKGVLSQELIIHYSKKIDDILNYIEKNFKNAK